MQSLQNTVFVVCCYVNDYGNEVIDQRSGPGLLGALVMAGSMMKAYGTDTSSRLRIDVFPTGTAFAPYWEDDGHDAYEKSIVVRFALSDEYSQYWVDRLVSFQS